MHLRAQMLKIAELKVGDLLRTRRELGERREAAILRLQQITGPDAMSWLRHVERIEREIAALAEPIEAARREQQAAARAEKLAREWRDELGRKVDRDDEKRALEEIAERAGWPRDASLG